MIYNLVVALAVLAVASANVHDRAFYEEEDEEEKFFEWMQEHKMEIANGGSFVKMLQNFADNHDIIEAHNAGNHSYKLGHNKFSHMGREEWKAYVSRGLERPDLRSEQTHNAPADLSTVPDSIDWTTGDKILVTSVKDQGQCGSCWSFSATGALEGAWAKAGNTLTSFSPQEFVDCDTRLNGGYGDKGCSGGLMDKAFKWAMGQPGLCTWESYPYNSGTTKTEGTCADSKCQSELGVPSGYTDVKTNNEDALKSAIALQPVSVAIEADQASFQLYSGGVFSGSCGAKLDHGVLAVGYGNDATTGEPFWKVKNSWGADWGENGYIRLTRNAIPNQPEGQCGILSGPPSYATYPEK